MVAHPVGPVVKNGAHAQIVFQMTEGVFDSQEVFVVSQHACWRDFPSCGVGAQKVESVLGGFGLDDRGALAPLQVALRVNGAVKVFVGFESLERASRLAGQFLSVGILAFD